MREEIIDGKTEILRTTIPGKEHPELVAFMGRMARLGRTPHHFKILVDAVPPLK